MTRLYLFVACLAYLTAALLASGAGYLHARHASLEALGLFLLALVCVVLGALAVPARGGGEGEE